MTHFGSSWKTCLLLGAYNPAELALLIEVKQSFPGGWWQIED
jgi:hypothetical protein